MSLAKRRVKGFVFRAATLTQPIQQYRAQVGNAGKSDLECFLGVIETKLSTPAVRTLKQAQKRYERYESLVERVISRSTRYKKFQNPRRPADFEEVVLREVIAAVATRNKETQWTFQGAGLTQLSDDFLLLLEYFSCYDGEDLRDVCDRFSNWFLTGEQKAQLTAIQDDTQRDAQKRELCKPIIRPLWLFFVALCHTLHEGEDNDLTAADAAWLGLIDEVIGAAEPISLRALVEWKPEPQQERKIKHSEAAQIPDRSSLGSPNDG